MANIGFEDNAFNAFSCKERLYVDSNFTNIEMLTKIPNAVWYHKATMN